MGILGAKYSDAELEEIRKERESAMYQPDVPPGMEEEDEGMFGEDFGSSFGDDYGGDIGKSFADEFGGGMLGANDFGGFGGVGMDTGLNQGVERGPSIEDKFWDGSVVVLKWVGKFLQDICGAREGFTTLKWMEWGRNVIFCSILSVIIGVVKLALHQVGLPFIVGGLLSGSVGVPVFMFSLEKVQRKSEDMETEEAVEFGDNTSEWESQDEYLQAESLEESALFDFEEEETEEETEEESEEEEEEEEECGWNKPISEMLQQLTEESKEIAETEEILETRGRGELEEEVKAEIRTEILEKLPTGDVGVTRAYLYEVFTSVMESATPEFSKVHDMDSMSREFLGYCKIVRDLLPMYKQPTNEGYPWVLKVKEKLFYDEVEMEQGWLTNKKAEDFISEFIRMCAYDEEKGEIDKSITGKGIVIGGKITIKVFKGTTRLISVLDAYGLVKDEVLDKKMKMPVVFGVDELGKVVLHDMYDLHALLVTGPPRSGKSWFVKSILAQMFMYSSPADVQFLFVDAKKEISDFYRWDMPHIRGFEGNEKNVLKLLQWVVHTEGPRRKQLLHTLGEIDIKDAKRKHINEELPFLYIVIDEIMSLTSNMTQESKSEFNSLLKTIVSEFPATGIRLILVPHMVKNDIISKNITDMIPCRVCVMGNEEEVARVTGTKGFGQRLTRPGTMAVKLVTDASAQFVQSTTLGVTNERIEDMMGFISDVWEKMGYSRFEKGTPLRLEEGKNKVTETKSNKTSLNVKDLLN